MIDVAADLSSVLDETRRRKPDARPAILVGRDAQFMRQADPGGQDELDWAWDAFVDPLRLKGSRGGEADAGLQLALRAGPAQPVTPGELQPKLNRSGRGDSPHLVADIDHAIAAISPRA